MKIFEIYNSTYEGKLPKITYIYNGYHGLKKGVGIHCNSKFVPLVLPVNEREHKLRAALESVIEAIIFKLWFMLGKDSIKCHGGELVFVEEIKIKGSADNATPKKG